jgi:nucleoside 2-deoxyribosyltransferase
MKIYFAASLFTHAERRWNKLLADELASDLPGLEVILPQDFETAAAHEGGGKHAELFRLCSEGVDRADAVVAVVDGADVDSGTAWEMGYAFAKGKPVVAVRTDFRVGEEYGVNLMISRGCSAFIDACGDEALDVNALAGKIAEQLQKWRK